MSESVNKTVNLTPELFARFVTDMRAHLAKRRKTQLTVTATAIEYFIGATLLADLSGYP